MIFCLLILLFEGLSIAYVCSSPIPRSLFAKIDQCQAPSSFIPHHYLVYQNNPLYFNEHNSLGLRGPEVVIPKPKGFYRIVVTGGSTTYDYGIKSWKDDFARQLQRELRQIYSYDKIEVINGGVTGYSSYESLINLEFKLLDTEPDMMIIYDNLNDVHARMVNPAFYKGDNSGRRKVFNSELEFPWNWTFARLLAGHTIGVDTYTSTSTTAFMSKESTFIDKINGTPDEVLAKNKPVYFLRNLRSMLGIAREFDVNVILATFAYTDKMNDYIVSPHYKKAISEQNDIIRQLSSSEHINFYDHATEFPNEAKYFIDGRHLNENGAKLKGAMFANYISKNKLIDNNIKLLKNSSQ